MTSESRSDNAAAALVAVAPVVRGVLAEPTGNEDFPWAPVLLSCRADAAAKADGPDAIAIDSLLPLDDDGLRDRLAAAVQEFAAGNGGKPCRLVLPKVGQFAVTSAADPKGGLQMRNRVAVVTGSAGAIGYAVCRKLLECGCHVVVTDLAGERLDRLADDLGGTGQGRVLKVPMDVTDRSSIASALATVAAAWGGIDVLVHNAGIAHVSTIAEMDLETFRRLERVNVDGTLLVLAEASEMLARQGTGGDIVIMSTKNVPSPSAGFGAYSATKAACHQLGRIASLELAPKGIRVNMVAPDAVFSEGDYRSGLWDEVGANRMKARGLDEKGLHEYYRSRNLLKARVTGFHVANAVYFFISRQTPTTGATIPVDGGLPDATPR